MDTRIYYFAIYATIHFTVRLPSRLTEGRIRRVLGTSRCGDRDAGIFDMRCAGRCDAAGRRSMRAPDPYFRVRLMEELNVKAAAFAKRGPAS